MSYKNCEACGKPIEGLVGYFWVPKDGPQKGEHLYFDTEQCKADYKAVYASKGGLSYDRGSSEKA